MEEQVIIFPFKKRGVECGFLACRERLFVFKPDKLSAASIPVENLKKNLRLMVKDRTARIVRTADIEAVAVQRSDLLRLFQ